MNYADTERMITVMEHLGYQAASNFKEADLLIVNMCSVRQSAVDRVYGLIPKIKKQKRENPHFQSILTGCILPSDKRKLRSSFDFLLDRRELSSWSKQLKSLRTSSSPSSLNYLKIKPTYQSSFRAFVPIMTGCNYRCSYCVVPFTRRQEYYRPAQDIIEEIQDLAQRNYQEIWLLGQNVNHYFSILNGKPINFAGLLQHLEKIKGNFWLYFTSPYPRDFSDEDIMISAQSKKLAPNFNLPLQSGDNAILKKMNRLYSVEDYKLLVQKIREAFQKYRKGLERYPTLSTDIIVGFPGEDKEAFQHTAQVLQELKFDAAHIAAYSPRPGTAAALFKNQVPQKEKQKRVKILNNILRETALENNQRYLGKTILVLIETALPQKKILLGRSYSYKTVKIKQANYQNLVGKKVKVKIEKVSPWQLEGKIINLQTS